MKHAALQVTTKKLKQYNSTYKHLLMVNNEPVCIVAGNEQASRCMQYLNGYNADIHDGKLRQILDACIEKNTIK